VLAKEERTSSICRWRGGRHATTCAGPLVKTTVLDEFLSVGKFEMSRSTHCHEINESTMGRRKLGQSWESPIGLLADLSCTNAESPIKNFMTFWHRMSFLHFFLFFLSLKTYSVIRHDGGFAQTPTNKVLMANHFLRFHSRVKTIFRINVKIDK
jgi:hypothetical protein